MGNKKWTRRQVLGSLAIMPFAVSATVSPLLKPTLSSISGIKQVNSKSTRCKLLNSKGEPFEVNKMSRFHICDLLS
jgi:hypothetical protein